MKPFLSIITRCYKRPKQLKRCITSIQDQTDPDYEHVLIRDEVGRGLFWANRQIHNCRFNLSGKWVYVLDDDDYLTDKNFIKDLKEIDASNDVDIIICKGYIGKLVYPKRGYWNNKPFIRGTLGSPNFAVKFNLFLKYSKAWHNPKAADFFFINAARGAGVMYWHNKKVFKAPIGDSKPERKDSNAIYWRTSCPK